jgi:crotonobetainyl-CoA:carnitine CoA-transferase CaiB-like acyl-CoA transferase
MKNQLSYKKKDPEPAEDPSSECIDSAISNDRMAGPAKGLKILDFTTLRPGPFATMTLADMGAEVLRIVSGSRPDLAAFPARTSPARSPTSAGGSAAWR